MSDNPLRCDGCSRESWPDGSIVLVVQHEPRGKTVRRVHVSCGPACTAQSSAESEAVLYRFEELDDVLDSADRIIAAHDWERGTVQRLSRVLAAVHQRRSA